MARPPLTKEEAAEQLARRSRQFNAPDAPQETPEVNDMRRLRRSRIFAGEILPDEPNEVDVNARTRQVLGQTPDRPILDVLKTGARQFVGKAVGPGGLPAIPAMAARVGGFVLDAAEPIQTAARKLATNDPDAVSPARAGLRNIADGIDTDAAFAEELVGAGPPLDKEDKFAGFVGESLPAGLTFAGALRAGVRNQAARGIKLGRIRKGIADESNLVFLGTEVAGATGESVGRILSEGGGAFVETFAAVTGSASFTLAPSRIKRSMEWIGSKLHVQFNDIDEQHAKLYSELIQTLEENGGLQKVLADPKLNHIIHDAAQRLKHAAGNQKDVDEAIRHMEDFEKRAEDLGMSLEDFTMGVLTGNQGLMDAQLKAVAKNPHLKQWMSLLHEPGSAKIRDTLIAQGPPLNSRHIDGDPRRSGGDGSSGRERRA